MNTSSIVALITGATALVTAVATLVRLLQHQASSNPHPNAGVPAGPPPAPGQVKAG